MKKLVFPFLCFICILGFTKCNSTDTKTTSETDSAAIVADSAKVTANWKIGVQMWTFRMFTFTEALDKVDSAGVKYIEAFWGQPLGGGMKDSFGISMSADSRKGLQELLQKKGISVV